MFWCFIGKKVKRELADYRDNDKALDYEKIISLKKAADGSLEIIT